MLESLTLHPSTLREITNIQANNGGAACCEQRGGPRWFLCAYHEGWDDAMWTNFPTEGDAR